MILTLMLLACGSDGKDTGATADASAGATVYAQSCAGCHGDPLTGGGTAPLLADEVPGESDDELRDVILNGEGDMPAIALTEQEVTHVIAYLRETIGG